MRFDFYSQRDSPDVTGGDNVFQGINMTLDKPLLQPGFLSLGENTRTRNGRVCQRRGTIMPGDFNPTEGFSDILIGSGVYRNPNGDEVMLVAPANETYTIVLQYGKDLYQVNYDAGVTGDNGTAGVEFVQSFDKVHLLRRPLQGSPAENLIWDGVATQTTPGVADSEWEVTTLSTEGLTLVPGVWNGEPFMDRIIFYFANFQQITNRDVWYLSDILDYTSYDDIFQSFRTNAGEADYITRIMAYFKGNVVIFKNHSIHMASLLNTFPVSINQRILSSVIGSIGNKMPLMIGPDVIFLSQPNGFYSLSEIIQEQITALPVPISEPIQRVIDSINWPVTAAFGCSAAVDNYAFFGVSLGQGFGTGRLNTILVYDTQRKQWESAGDTWTDPAFSFSALHVTNYDGVRRLFAIDYARGIVYLLYEGVHDEMPHGIFSVPFKMETRGYTGEDPLSFKRFGRAIVGISTSDPSITVTAISDGMNEEKILTPEPITKDRTRFYTHGSAPFDPETDSATAPKREDYSIVIDSDVAVQDYEAIRVGDVTAISGTLPEQIGDTQQSLERLVVRSWGRWCALRIENTSGICEVTTVGVESTRALNTGRMVA